MEQSTLRSDVEVVRRYGEAHPEAWVEVRFENDPSVRIVALFSGNSLSEHEHALRELVAHPDQLEVHSAPWSKVHLEAIRNEILELATSDPGSLQSLGIGRGRVKVRLRADQQNLAEQLKGRYDDAIVITVGFFLFPMDESPRSARMPALLENAPKAPHFPESLRVSVENVQVRSGNNVRSMLHMANDGPEDVVVETNGAVTARVVNPETNEVVGLYSGAQHLPAVRFHAPRHQAVDIPLLVGTASTVRSLGYAVPPGRWAIEVPLQLEGIGDVVTPLLPITVIA
jgi:hypothetical protein